ncbi:hypothetical protein H8E07_10885 [bacterium]|nr:hypothetical protein [bacterium]
MLGLAILLSTPAAAGIGKGSSISVRLDAEPPQVGILTDMTGLTLDSGDTFQFDWWSADSHPALHDSSRVAAVLVAEEVVDETAFSTAYDQSWPWSVYYVYAIDCVFEVTVRDEFGLETTDRSAVFTIYTPTVGTSDVPAAATLAAPAPNPFNPRTNLAFTLAEAGPARLTVYDLQGRLVRRLHDGELAAGPHVRAWDGRGDGGRRLAGGPYLVRLDAPGAPPQTRKVVLLP